MKWMATVLIGVLALLGQQSYVHSRSPIPPFENYVVEMVIGDQVSSGIVINDEWILTTGQRIESGDASKITSLRVHNYNEKELKPTIDRVVKHPSYDFNRNNLALIKVNGANLLDGKRPLVIPSVQPPADTPVTLYALHRESGSDASDITKMELKLNQVNEEDKDVTRLQEIRGLWKISSAPGSPVIASNGDLVLMYSHVNLVQDAPETLNDYNFMNLASYASWIQETVKA